MKDSDFYLQPTTTFRLNTSKINTLDDVKRVLDFLDINVSIQEGLTVKGFDKVEDLFGN